MNNYEIAAEEMIKELSKVRAENERLLSINRDLVEAAEFILSGYMSTGNGRISNHATYKLKAAIEKVTPKQP